MAIDNIKAKSYPRVDATIERAYRDGVADGVAEVLDLLREGRSAADIQDWSETTLRIWQVRGIRSRIRRWAPGRLAPCEPIPECGVGARAQRQVFLAQVGQQDSKITQEGQIDAPPIPPQKK